MRYLDKRFFNFIIIILLTFISFWWTFFIFHVEFDSSLVLSVVFTRIMASFLILKDYSMSWSKASQKTFLIKSSVYLAAFVVYVPFYYGKVRFSFLVSELFTYLFIINFIMYLYYFLVNRSTVVKTKSMVIYGAGKAGVKLESEFSTTQYRIEYFIDDNKVVQNRSIDGIRIVSKEKFKKTLGDSKIDLLVIAMPSAPKQNLKSIYDELGSYFKEIRVLPPIDKILRNKDFSAQLKDVSVEDLLARHPQDLDKEKIKNFIKDKTVLVTGAGGSIGSEICRQCEKFSAKKIILLDHSEYNLYTINEELKDVETVPVMQNILDIEALDRTFDKYRPEIVIHAAAYKHVPLVEANISEGLRNNILGTKNVIDTSIKYKVEKFVMISTDKAVRPTNVMGASKRVCELYAQNVRSRETEIVAVRFGNVLGSSGSVIPKFRSQIEKGADITVTHPDITRYFMLIPEACELVLQAAAIGKGGEIFILDMGDPIKIVDLAKKMIELSGNKDINIVFTGLRPGEKLYEELLIDDSDQKTSYESITVAKSSIYDIDKLNNDIDQLMKESDKLAILKRMVPEFEHKLNAKG